MNSTPYAECIDDPYAIKSDTDLRSAVFCLQQEVTVLKGSVAAKERVMHVVQVIATSDKNYANEVKDSFNVFGYRSFISTTINTNPNNKYKTLYKVMIGPYEWKDEANEAKNQIRKKYQYFNKSFVTSIILK